MCLFAYFLVFFFMFFFNGNHWGTYIFCNLGVIGKDIRSGVTKSSEDIIDNNKK